MNSNLTKPPSDALSALLLEDRQRAREVRRHVRAASTLEAYDQAWRAFAGWCESRGIAPVPASDEDVCAYLAWLAAQRPTPRPLRRSGIARPDSGARTMSWSVVVRAYSAIAMVFRHAQAPGWQTARATPTLVREQLDALQRTVGRAPRERKDPVELAALRALVTTIRGEDLVSVRDRAILLLTFLACNRRSETARLDVEDIAFTPEGFIVTLDRSKTDQESIGTPKGVLAAERETDLCPVAALKRWLAASGVVDGALFRAVRHDRVIDRRVTGRLVATIIKRAARAAGFDEASVARLSGHSLRSGFITAAARRGVDPIAIARQSAHRDLNSLRPYIRLASLFVKNPSEGMI